MAQHLLISAQLTNDKIRVSTMTEHNPRGTETRAEINPYVSRLASKLIKTAANANLPVDSKGWQLISEVLSFAASAEKRLTEQQDRISFLEQLSVTDELTGIANRRGLRDALGRILAGAARSGRGGVLGFVDLDRFKQINDTHGHMAGDAVLRAVANKLKAQTRPTDAVARVSGDEFAVILAECDADLGMRRMRVLQQELDALDISYAGRTIDVSCSIGVRPYTGASDPAELIEDADKAMYMDKKARCGAHLRSAG